jgi:hypothetical protein
MKARFLAICVFVLMLGASVGPLAFSLVAQSVPAAKTDAQIKDEIVQASIASYSGSCPCPYHRDRAGRSCGRRSATAAQAELRHSATQTT